MAAAMDLAATPWGILDGGALTGKYLTESDEPRRDDGASERVNAIAREVVAVADELGVTPSQVATAWVRQQPWPLVPIVGARSEAQMRENLGALELELSPSYVERLDELSDFRAGFARDFLESDHVRGLIFGDTFDLIDDHRRPAVMRREVPVV
jgi:aryl-alcohol dehydrogenase-like predicted oxidoreductase